MIFPSFLSLILSEIFIILLRLNRLFKSSSVFLLIISSNTLFRPEFNFTLSVEKFGSLNDVIPCFKHSSRCFLPKDHNSVSSIFEHLILFSFYATDNQVDYSYLEEVHELDYFVDDIYIPLYESIGSIQFLPLLFHTIFYHFQNQ